MKPLLSILIPTLPEPDRIASFQKLRSELERQRMDSGEPLMIEIDIDDSPRGTKTIGEKRNDLVSKAKGEYIAFIDDDDQIASDYIKLIIDTIRSNNYPDCTSLSGVITWDGDWDSAESFEHSIRFDRYNTNDAARFNLFHWVGSHTGDVKYERFPNHLNAIKTDIAKQFKFPHNNFGEDTSFAEQLHRSGLIKTEGRVNKVIYHYDYKKNK